jgi:hypothetical protein
VRSILVIPPMAAALLVLTSGAATHAGPETPATGDATLTATATPTLFSEIGDPVTHVPLTPTLTGQVLGATDLPSAGHGAGEEGLGAGTGAALAAGAAAAGSGVASVALRWRLRDDG